MLTFSRDPKIAEQQMDAIVFSLTTFGYIDGDFDESEKAFVREYVGKLVEHRVDTGIPDADPAVRADLVARFRAHFLEKFETIDAQVRELFNEPAFGGEDRNAFVHAKLKQRCFEIFQAFDRPNREAILETVDEFIRADGHLHPAETKFRSELAALLGSDLDVDLVDEGAPPALRASIAPAAKIPGGEDHPFFKQFEHHYSADPKKISKQVAADLSLIDRLLEQLAAQRETGAGKLDGKQTLADLAPGERFLDGWTYALMPERGRAYELLVLGDLHGCYSCLKGAIMQTHFLERVEAFRRDPTLPEPRLVLLGDYIDRGMFSLNGVLRTVMQLAITAPDHVCVLRGNHEYYVEIKGQIFGGVRPAEAINTLKPHLPLEVFRKYMQLFDELPNYLLFDRMLFVHGGIPRDRTLKEKWKDLSSLNDPEIRFQMMWSDPSAADVIPAALQEQTARFPFGRLQFQSFLQRLGAQALVRGHEKVDEGFRRVYDDDAGLLVTLFSAGGKENGDLPLESSYRTVEPMALTIARSASGQITLTPFEIDWASYNDPDRNAFFQTPFEIAHRIE